MEKLSFTKKELEELDSIQILGGMSGGADPLAQMGCKNETIGCGSGVDQTNCSNAVVGCTQPAFTGCTISYVPSVCMPLPNPFCAQVACSKP